MKRTLIVAGLISAAGLVMATPATAAPPDSTVSCSPAFLCSVKSFVSDGPKTFVDSIKSGPKTFADSVTSFVKDGPTTFVKSITDPFGPVSQPAPAASADTSDSAK